MSEDAAAFWDERYRERGGIPESGPAAFLIENLGLLPAGGRALDIAMGAGRNALLLAERGYDVTGIDVSPVAVERCRQAASQRGLRVDAICADMESYTLPEAEYDIVLNFYYLQRDLCPAIERALRPGGTLVFETFTTEQRRFGWGPSQDEYLLRPGELRELFPLLEMLVYREAVTESERGRKAVAWLVARKPLPAT